MLLGGHGRAEVGVGGAGIVVRALDGYRLNRLHQHQPMTMRNITHILFAITSIPTFAQGPPTIQWQVRVGGSGADEASTIVRTADDGYLVTGQTTSEDLGGTAGSLTYGS